MPLTYQDFIASKKGRLITSQMAGVLRAIYFLDRARTMEEVELQNRQGFVSTCSFGIPVSRMQSLSLTLGWKRDAVERVDDIGALFISGVTELGLGDRESFADTIRETIQDSLVDPNIFRLRQVYGETNLFALLPSANPIDSVRRLIDKVYLALLRTLCDWLTIFPLQSVKAEPFSLAF